MNPVSYSYSLCLCVLTKSYDFLLDLKNAKENGAAGWCFHNGDTRGKEGGRPRRSFDMRKEEGRLFDQLDEEEKKVVNQVKGQ